MFKSTPLRFFLLQVLISSSSSSFSRRIVGGFPVEISRCPYQVSVQDVERNEHFCGGSIIGNLWVVSAGHCFEPEILPSNYYIRAGSTRHKVGGITVAAKKIILHEDYHKENYALYNDISLIMLDSPLTFNTYIQPILLPDSDATPKQGIAGIVSGWGSLKDGENEPLSDNLMAAKIYVIEKSECQEVFKLLNVNLTDGLICAGTARSKRDACFADSGGALKDTINDHLIGIVSFSIGCANENFPGIYTNVPYYRNWILQHTGL